jgi:uncharacterized protein YydD (DUF2326 family)
MKEQYKPSSEEVKKAEDMMTEEQKEMSETRESDINNFKERIVSIWGSLPSVEISSDDFSELSKTGVKVFKDYSMLELFPRRFGTMGMITLYFPKDPRIGENQRGIAILHYDQNKPSGDGSVDDICEVVKQYNLPDYILQSDEKSARRKKELDELKRKYEENLNEFGEVLNSNEEVKNFLKTSVKKYGKQVVGEKLQELTGYSPFSKPY